MVLNKYISNNWISCRLDECFDIQQGKQVSKKNRVGDNQHPFLRTANVFWGKFDLSVLDKMNFTKNEEQKFALQKGDLLVCEGGDIGRTAVWDSELDNCYYQNHLHRLRKKADSVYEQFVFFYLQYAFVYAKLYFGRANITTIPNLSKSRLSELEILLPPLREQKAIARILTTIQEAIAAQEVLIAKLKELKRSMMQYLFTHGTKGEKTKMTEIGEIPESWGVVKLDDICNEIIGGGTPSTKNPDYWLGNNPWITSKWLNDELFLTNGEKYISNQAIKNSATHIVPANSLIFATRVGVGKVAINKFNLAINQDLAGLIIKDGVNNKFIAYFLRNEFTQTYIKSLKRGATIQGITREDMKGIAIALPNHADQTLVAETIFSIDKKLEAIRQKLLTYQNLFITLLHELMSGTRRVVTKTD